MTMSMAGGGGGHDPRAIAHAKSNARLSKIRCAEFKSIDFLRWKTPQRYEVITANLYNELLIAAVTVFGRALRRDGTLILSGILRDQAPEVLAALRRTGYCVDQRRRGKWVALRCVTREIR